MSLTDIAEVCNGYSYKGIELQQSNTAIATIKNFNRFGGFKSDGFKEIVPSNKIKQTHYVMNTEILVAHTDLTQNADIIGNAEILLNDFGYSNIIASMDLVKLRSIHPRISNYSLLLIVKNAAFKNHCLGYINGTTVLHLSKKALPNYRLALPLDTSLLIEFDSIVTPLFERMKKVQQEIESLTILRDILLPKLISGEISVES